MRAKLLSCLKWGVCLLALVPGGMARAELSPESYARMQREAPEYLEVEVLRVSTVRTKYEAFTDVAVTVEARIRAVHRSATGLRAGELVSIRYQRREHGQPLAGPSQRGATPPGWQGVPRLCRKAGEWSLVPSGGGWFQL